MGVSAPSALRARMVLAVALATPVHLVAAVIAGTGITLLWTGSSLWPRLLAVGCLVLAAFLEVHPGDSWRVRRRSYPAGTELDLPRSTGTAALLRTIAAAVGSRVPRRCVLTTAFGARIRMTRHGRTLEVGAPLWLALDTEERLALLARTLATRGTAISRVEAYVASAAWSLGRWREMFTPASPPDDLRVYDPIVATSGTDVLAGRAQSRLGMDVVSLVLWPPRALTAGYQRVLAAAAAPVRRAAEQRADDAAATVAGVTALAGLRRALEDREVVATLLQRATRTGLDLQTALCERTARVYADRPVSAAPPGSVEVDLDEWARIDREWAPAVAEQFAQLRSAYR